MRKGLAIVLATSLLWLSPGIGCYEALAGGVGRTPSRLVSRLAMRLRSLPGVRVLKFGGGKDAGTRGDSRADRQQLRGQPLEGRGDIDDAASHAEEPANERVAEIEAGPPASEREQALFADGAIAAAPGEVSDPGARVRAVVRRTMALFSRRAAETLPEQDGTAVAADPALAVDGDAALAKDQGRPAHLEHIDYKSIHARAKAERAEALSAIARKAVAPFSVQGFDTSERAYMKAQTIFVVALTIQSAAIALFVQTLTGDIADTGTALMVQRFALAFASVFAARWVARTPMVRVLRLTGTARSAIFLGASALALAGMLPLWGYMILLAANGVMIAANTLVDLDENGASMVFSTPEKADKALYLYDNRAHALAVALPVLLGVLMDWLNAVVAPGFGPQLAIGFMGVATLWATLMYGKVKPIIDNLPTRKMLPFFAALALMARSVYRNGVTRGVILIRTLERFLEESIFNVILPIYGAMILFPKATTQTLLVSAAELGGWFATGWLLAQARELKERLGVQKFLVLITVAAAATFLPSIAFWALQPALLIGLAIAFTMKLFYQPLRSESTRQLQRALANDPLLKEHGAAAFSVLRILIMLGAGAGGGAFTWLVKASVPGSFWVNTFGANAPFKVLTLSLLGLAGAYFVGLSWIKRQLAAAETPASPPPATAVNVGVHIEKRNRGR